MREMVSVQGLFDTVTGRIKVHKVGCKMLNTGKKSGQRGVAYARYRLVPVGPDDLLDYEEQELPVSYCRCVKKEIGED